MEYFAYILLSIIILLVMVLIHEIGHYTTAKILGFTVEEFSVGFGPKIFQKRRKCGELFSLRVLPLGGYCSFLGETDDEQAEKAEKTVSTAEAKKPEEENGDDLLDLVMRSKTDEEPVSKPLPPAEKTPPRLDKNGEIAKTFNEQKPWKRIIVLLGGVLFNFLSAFIFSLIYIWAVGYSVPVVSGLYTDEYGVQYALGLNKGDVIIAVDDNKISVLNSYSDLTQGVKRGDTVTLKIERNGEVSEVDVVSRDISYTDENGELKSYLGFGFVSSSVYTGNNALSAFKYCVPYTFKLSWAILGSFGGLFTGKVPITSMSGPIGSINLMAQLSVANWRNILILLPLLASNLAIFNLLPFPALDGAHIVFTVIEWIRKKPVNRKVEGMIHFVGMIVLLLFVLVVDILSFAL